MILNRKTSALFVLFILSLWLQPVARGNAADSGPLVYNPPGAGNGKHIVFLAGDEEYRSEESLPMLAKILSQRDGFKCTVLFSEDPDGTINPNNLTNYPHAEALDSADEIIMLMRFRNWPDDVMKHFADAIARGVPVIGLRTSTHAFAFKNGTYVSFNGFGKHQLGEKWVNHWGKHSVEGTRAIIEPSAKGNPLLNGVNDIFVTTDVYEAYPPVDATILLRGQVTTGLNPADPPADYKRKRTTDHKEQGINDPMMPIAWSRIIQDPNGKTVRRFCTTMGAAQDFLSEDLRRLVVNAAYWGLGMDIPARADVTLVGDYQPHHFDFNGFTKGVRPEDLALKDGGPTTAPAVPATQTSADFLKLHPGDHIAIIGNTLADRMQFDGYLETLIHAAHPQDQLVVRNLAVSGDEVVTRARSLDFGTPDEWLAKVKADVVFVFFGFNESFHGPAGLDQFKAELDTFLKGTLAQNYSGRGHPRVILFSPVANERLPDPNYRDPSANNANIKLYTDAMREVAQADGVQFVDLFTPSLQLYADAAAHKQSLTINEIHLSPEGDKALAPVIYRGIFGIDPPTGDFEPLRAAVNAKNWMWHTRYRTVDGYNVYGGRSREAYAPATGGPEVTNREVMQAEMSQRDVMTADQDKVVWAAAIGKVIDADYSNLPPVQKVSTNDPGDGPNGTWNYPSGEAAISQMKIPPHTKVNLFASEEQFPELVNPVQMAWDTKGRLWVSVWPNYPERTPTSKSGDSILIFEDTHHTGHADKCIHFIDDLNCPTGFQFYKDGILLMQAPDLWFVRDTTGGDHANWKQRILMGMDSADSHHTTNSMVLDPGGATYLSDGVFHRTQVETFDGPVRNLDGCIYRFEPLTGKFERYAPYGFANPHGRVFDYWGNDLITDATGNDTYFGPAISGHLDYPLHHARIAEFWARPSRPCPGTQILTTHQFPDEYWGNFLNCNVIGFQGIYRVKVTEDGSGLRGDTLDPLISSPDPTFRPSQVNVGPDGAIYIANWSQALIGHLQHHLRDPNRNHVHGRIYRMVYTDRPLETPVQIDGQPIPVLLDLLKRPENQIRTLAKIELAKRDPAEVIAALDQWISHLNPSDSNYSHDLTEALWEHQWLNVVDESLLKKLLRSDDPHARTAATRVLCYWRDRIPDALSLLQTQAEDESPRTRLEAVRAASFFDQPQAVDVALAAISRPKDYYLDYILQETLRQLRPIWEHDLGSGQSIGAGNPAGLTYLLHQLSTTELEKLPHTPVVLTELLERHNAPDPERLSALSELAAMQKTTGATVLLNLLSDEHIASDMARLGTARFLGLQPQSDLQKVRPQLMQLAANSPSELIRNYAWAAMALADQSFDTVWNSAFGQSATGSSFAPKADLLNGIPLVFDSELRATAAAKVLPLLEPDVQQSEDVRKAAIAAAASMPHQQQQIFSTFVKLIDRGIDVPEAARGIHSLRRKAWNNAEAGDAAQSIVKWAQQVPKDQRTDLDYIETVQFGSDLAGVLPAAQAAVVNKQLRELKVATFVIKTLREQMKYDTTRIVVEAGKDFQIIFKNDDFMPHNLAVVKPGTRKQIGQRTAKMAPDQLDREGRAFMPKSPDILDATKLVEPGQQTVLHMTAPTDEGVYEYFCTYPGHWDRMWGQLIVTRDVDAYLAAHPTDTAQ